MDKNGGRERIIEQQRLVDLFFEQFKDEFSVAGISVDEQGRLDRDEFERFLFESQQKETPLHYKEINIESTVIFLNEVASRVSPEYQLIISSIDPKIASQMLTDIRAYRSYYLKKFSVTPSDADILETFRTAPYYTLLEACIDGLN